MAKKKIKSLIAEAKRLPARFQREIWDPSVLQEKSLRGKYFAVLRFLAITWKGVWENNLLGSAAALSFSTLLALGPMLMIAIMISGFVLQASDSEDNATEIISRVIYFVAPQTQDFTDELGGKEVEGADKGEGPVDQDRANEQSDGEEDPMVNETIAINPQLLGFIDSLVEKSRSGAVGLVGSLVLIAISIQLIISIEGTFNSIWGVRKGRPMMQRIVLYWTLISLGAVLGFAAIFLLTASTIKRFFDYIPYGLGEQLFHLGLIGAPLISFTIVAFLLGVFYRFIPNCYVRWRPALVGGVLVALLLVANNYLSFLYINRAVRAQSLYGSVGIVPLLMFGLYVFWVFVLIGGLITHGVQNLSLLSNQRAWSNTAIQTRQMLSVAALLVVARRFQEGRDAISQQELSQYLSVPANILNQSLNELVALKLLSPVAVDDDEEEDIVHYQPNRPLESITLTEVREKLETAGNTQGSELIVDCDPLLQVFRDELLDYSKSSLYQRNLAELLKEHPTAKAQ